MLTVALDESNDIPAGGPKLVTGMDAVATEIRAVLSVQAGEWAFDLDFGTRWRDVVLTKFFDASATRAMLAATVNTVAGHEPVTPEQISIDTATLADVRQVIITINDVIVDGEQFDLSVETTV